MKRRHDDPLVLAQSSALLRAWRRRMADQAAGDDLADERWYAYLRTIARPVPKPACDACDDTGMLFPECTITMRCGGHVCAKDDRRSDRDWTHTYARACWCAAGEQFRRSFAAANEPVRHVAPKQQETKYGFRRATA